MRPVKFTLAICTWNRAALLAQTLERITRMEPPRAPWEIVVVNNNSTDATEQVLEAFAARLPLRRVFERAPGVSHARNAAVRHAAGDYVLWTDDDVLVDAGWLTAYERALERWPEAAVFGGPARPRFEGKPPPWLSAIAGEVGAAFATRELSAEPFELADDDRIPWGVNYAVRMREQRQFPYDPALGRNRAGGALGEETAVIRAILRAGSPGWWVPDAVVEHWIPKGRQTIRHLRSYYALLGRTYYRWDHRHGAAMLRGRPLWLWRKALRAEGAYALARLSGDPNCWVKSLVQASVLRGAIGR